MTQTRWDILKDHTVIQKNIDRLFRKFFTLPTAPHSGQVTAEVKGGRIKILVKVIKN